MKLVVGLLLVFSVVCTSKQSSLASFANFKYGLLNNSALQLIADNLPSGRLQNSVEWLAKTCKLFSFVAKDGLTIQGYFIPGNLVSRSLSLTESDESVLRPIVFSSGWSETAVKNAPTLYELNTLGHDIFCFDLRGQGFSDSVLYDKKTGKKLSHISSLDQLVDDLELFISKVLPERFHSFTNNYYSDSQRYQLLPSYIGFSFSGLIGPSLVHRNPTVLGPQNYLVLLSPCIQPAINPIVKLALKAFSYFGWNEMMLDMELDDPKPKLTHSPENNKAYFTLLNLARDQLMIACSVGLLTEMMRGGEAILKAAPSLDVDLLVIQAELDTIVVNSAQDDFFSKVGSAVDKSQEGCAASASNGVCDAVDGVSGISRRSKQMIKIEGAYHVLLDEEDHISKRVFELIHQRLS